MTDDPVELSWIAGLLEMNGHISVQTKNGRKYAHVQISADHQIIAYLARLTGTKTPPPGERVRWTLTGTEARKLLIAIRPYLFGPRSEYVSDILYS